MIPVGVSKHREDDLLPHLASDTCSGCWCCTADLRKDVAPLAVSWFMPLLFALCFVCSAFPLPQFENTVARMSLPAETHCRFSTSGSSGRPYSA